MGSHASERSQRFNPEPRDGWYLTTGEIGDLLRASRMTVYRLIERGELEAVRVGKSYRISEGALSRYIERQTKKGA
jgi:excisionase family DNA binding protein